MTAVDGRVARGERTRRAVVDAHTELLRAGVLRPTAQVVADRAGIAVRTLWANFGDLEGLLQATTAHWLALDEAMWTPVDPTLPLDERITTFCARRAERMEHLDPGARSSVLGEPFSPALREARAVHTQRLRDDLVHTFGAGHPIELVLLASWPAWSVLRGDLGLSADEATRVTTEGFTHALA